MGSWFVKPDIVQIPLSDGQWIKVKQRLNAGEMRDIVERCYTATDSPVPRMNPSLHGASKIVGYIVDWSLTDDGTPVVVADKSPTEVMSILNALDVEHFQEILQAIEAHEAAMDSKQAAAKNAPDGVSGSSAISSSVSVSAGDSRIYAISR